MIELTEQMITIPIYVNGEFSRHENVPALVNQESGLAINEGTCGQDFGKYLITHLGTGMRVGLHLETLEEAEKALSGLVGLGVDWKRPGFQLAAIEGLAAKVEAIFKATKGDGDGNNGDGGAGTAAPVGGGQS